MLVPDRLKTNSYRVLRLPANATLSEIHKARGSMNRAAALGVAGTTESDLPQLGDVPRNEADIRAAIGRLENPAERLRDRVFWFHRPLDTSTGAAIRGQNNGADWRHDDALRSLFAALETGPDDAGVRAWVRALREWHQVVSDDEYWALTFALEQRGAFEPIALPSEIDALRNDAVGFAAEPLVVAGRDALARDDTSTVRRIEAALEELCDTGPWSVIAQQDIASPAVERLRTLCRAVHDESSSKIVREQDAGELNKGTCDGALRRFRGEIEPALNRVLQVVPPDHEAAQQSRELAALCLNGIATDYTWADDFVFSEKLYEEALTLAHDTLGAIKIENGLAQIREAAWKQRALESLTPVAIAAVKSFGALCVAVREECGSKIVREQDKGAPNKSVCDAALRRFRSEIEPALNRVLQVVPPDHEAAQQSREQAALCLNGIAIDYTWADDFVTSEKVRVEALSLAHDTGVENLIQEGLVEISKTVQNQRRLGKPISSAPALFTLNGFGLTLYGNSDYDKETNSFATTHYLVAFFVPILPITRYRVIQDGKQYRFLGKLPFRKIDRWHFGITAAAIVAMIIIGTINGMGDSNQSSSPEPPTSQSSGSSSSAPISENPQLSELKARIDSGRASMQPLKIQLQPVLDEITSLDAQIETLKAELKSLDEQQKAGIQIDIDDYNGKVKTHNELLAKERALIAANRSDLKTYDDLVEQDAALVKQYNALLK